MLFVQIDSDWTSEQLIVVMNLWQVVEAAYETGVAVVVFQEAYRQFKQVVPSKGEERRLGRAFEQASGYSLYRVHQAAQQQKKRIFITEPEQLSKGIRRQHKK